MTTTPLYLQFLYHTIVTAFRESTPICTHWSSSWPTLVQPLLEYGVIPCWDQLSWRKSYVLKATTLKRHLLIEYRSLGSCRFQFLTLWRQNVFILLKVLEFIQLEESQVSKPNWGIELWAHCLDDHHSLCECNLIFKSWVGFHTDGWPRNIRNKSALYFWSSQTF